MARNIENKKDPDDLYVQALLLAKVVERVLKHRADIELSSAPKVELKPITEFIKRMRISGLTKFDERTYISTVNFYKNEKDGEQKKAIGAIIIYLPEMYVFKLLNELQYPAVIDEDDQAALLDACGTFCTIVAGNFKSGLTQLGYQELVMSHFSNYQNDVLNGVEYDPTQKELYEINFEIKGVKRIVADLTMGPILKVNQEIKERE